MYGLKKSLRPKARSKSLGSTRHPSNKNMDERTYGSPGAGTRHPTGKNINEQSTIVFKRAKPKARGK